MYSVGASFLSVLDDKKQKERFFISPETLRKLQECGMLVEFFWSAGIPRDVREFLKTLTAEKQMEFVVSSIKTRDGKDWDGSPLYLDNRTHEKWWWLIPEVNEHTLEGVKEMVDARFPHPCFRNTSDVLIFPPSYGPVSSQ
jgi:hypothetical protein